MHQLADAVAREQARREWRLTGARTEAEALGYYVSRLRRSWGIAAAREMARTRLRRVQFVSQSLAFDRPTAQLTECRCSEARAT